MATVFRVVGSICRRAIIDSTTISTTVGRAMATSAHSAEGVSGGHKNRLLLTLSSPTESIYLRNPVESVTLPGIEGAMTVTNHHSQMVTQLRNGVVTVRTSGSDQTASSLPAEYFISDGFLVYKSAADDSGCCTADVMGVQVVPTDAIDKEQAALVLQEVLQKSAAATSDWDKARGLLA
eukprot:GHVT01040755.1.p2 GENE.GHVT01040755.1~~GHVT01040755.1.p2  ORF type:complete len:179 (+),score=17.35 GHVT01040755.1:240-776(+)